MSSPTRRANALLLAGGLGTRLRPLTDTIPKCLVPIADRPLLDFWIDRLAEVGVGEARINTHSLADQVRGYIEGVRAGGRLHLVESHEPELLGSAGTVAANPDLGDGVDEVVIIYADNFSDIDLRPLLDFHRSHEDPFTMVLFRAPNPRACGIAELDRRGKVVSFVEKPEQPASDLANAGIYVVDADAFREIAAMRAFDLGHEVLPRFVGRMRGWLWGGYYLDVGTHEALDRARRDALELFPARPDPAANGLRPAVFLDRDGTMIESVHYLDDPDHLRLAADAVAMTRRLRRAGFACVIATNQSAIGRGLLTEARLHEIHAELGRQLAEGGATIDGIYFCPDVPAGDDRTLVESRHRKPGPGMLLQAADELGLDLTASWMIGDMISDVLAGLNAGCRSILLTSAEPTATVLEAGAAGTYLTATSLDAAADLILDHARGADR